MRYGWFFLIICSVGADPLVCSANIAETVQHRWFVFSAGGGNGRYAWSADGDDVLSASGNQYVTRYHTIGGKNITVRSGDQLCSIAVTVLPAPLDMPADPHGDIAFYRLQPYSDENGEDVFSFGSIFWSSNLTKAAVTVRQPGAEEILFSCGTEGSIPVDWLRNGQAYIVTLWETITRSWTRIDAVWIKPGSNDVLDCSPSNSINFSGSRFAFSASGGTGQYYWDAGKDAQPRFGTGKSFAASFAIDHGYETVYVSSAGQKTACVVQVR